MILPDRAVLCIHGSDCTSFLQKLITIDVVKLPIGCMQPSALLSAQGKILFTFYIGRSKDAFYIDIAQAFCAGLQKHLLLYKLRADVVMEVYENKNVFLSTQTQRSASIDFSFLVQSSATARPLYRAYFEKSMQIDKEKQEAPQLQEEAWENYRMLHGLAQIGVDFQPQEVFPFDINYDLIGGISFNKGCYIGQEVVAKMAYRSNIRRRLLIACAQESFSQAEGAIYTQGQEIGFFSSACGKYALARIRIDKAKMAIEAKRPLLAQNLAIKLFAPQGIKAEELACFAPLNSL